MRKWLCAVSCVLLAGLCACGRAEPEPEPNTTTAQATTTAAPTTTEPPTMEPIECPASYKDAPEAYWPILDNLYIYVRAVRQGNKDLAWDAYQNLLIPSLHSNSSTEDLEGLGYAIADINRDGIPELVILYKDFPVNYHSPPYVISLPYMRTHVTSIYTLVDDKPVDLIFGGSRAVGRFVADGTLYTLFSMGHGLWFNSYKLEPGADRLMEIKADLYSNNFILDYKNVSGEQESRPFTQEEFDAMIEQYDNPPNPMQFNFIPID